MGRELQWVDYVLNHIARELMWRWTRPYLVRRNGRSLGPAPQNRLGQRRTQTPGGPGASVSAPVAWRRVPLGYT
jgi:hypothetical protein